MVCACAHAQLFGCSQLFETPLSVTYHAPLSMRFPRQEYWSGLPFPSPGDLPDLGIEPSYAASGTPLSQPATTYEMYQAVSKY